MATQSTLGLRLRDRVGGARRPPFSAGIPIRWRDAPGLHAPRCRRKETVLYGRSLRTTILVHPPINNLVSTPVLWLNHKGPSGSTRKPEHPTAPARTAHQPAGKPTL